MIWEDREQESLEVVTLGDVQEIRTPLPTKCVAAQEWPGVPSVLAVPRSGHEEDLQSQDVGSCTGRAASLLGAVLQSSPPGASRRAQNRVPRAETQGDPRVAEGGSWQPLPGLALGLLLLGLSSGSRGRSSGRTGLFSEKLEKVQIPRVLEDGLQGD